MEQQEEFIMDPKTAKPETDEGFHHHTDKEWDKIAENEMRPTEHKLGPEKEDEPLTIEEARKRFEEIRAKITNGGKAPFKKVELPATPISGADAQARWEEINKK